MCEGVAMLIHMHMQRGSSGLVLDLRLFYADDDVWSLLTPRALEQRGGLAARLAVARASEQNKRSRGGAVPQVKKKGTLKSAMPADSVLKEPKSPPVGLEMIE